MPVPEFKYSLDEYKRQSGWFIKVVLWFVVTCILIAHIGLIAIVISIMAIGLSVLAMPFYKYSVAWLGWYFRQGQFVRDIKRYYIKLMIFRRNTTI